MGGESSSDSIHDSIEMMEYHNELQWKLIFVHSPVPMWNIKPTISGDNIIIVGYSDAEGRTKKLNQMTIDEMISSMNQPLSIGTVSKKWKKVLDATHWDTVTVPYSNPPVIIGGQSHANQGSVHTSNVTLYDVSKNLWRKVDTLTSARKHVGVALINNRTLKPA